MSAQRDAAAAAAAIATERALAPTTLHNHRGRAPPSETEGGGGRPPVAYRAFQNERELSNAHAPANGMRGRLTGGGPRVS